MVFHGFDRHGEFLGLVLLQRPEALENIRHLAFQTRDIVTVLGHDAARDFRAGIDHPLGEPGDFLGEDGIDVGHRTLLKLMIGGILTPRS